MDVLEIPQIFLLSLDKKTIKKGVNVFFTPRKSPVQQTRPIFKYSTDLHADRTAIVMENLGDGNRICDNMQKKLDKIREFARSATPPRIINLVENIVERKLSVCRPRSYPLFLDVILTKACNLNCTFCISSTVEENRWLDYALYERIARKLFPYASSLSFCSGGEPLLYPKLRDALRLADSYRIKTRMVSNGMLLSDEISQWMTAEQTLRYYYLSFDGSTKSTLEKIRRGAKFERIIENIGNLTRQKRDAGVKYPRLGLRYSVMKENAEELPGICRLAKSMGMETVDVSYVNFANDMQFENSLFWQQDFAAEIFRETAARAVEHGITVNLPALPGNDGHPRRCRDPWEFVQIDSDGTIRFCYRAWIQTVGRFDDGFDSIWRGKDYSNIRRTMHTRTPYFPYCAYCSKQCGMNNEAAHNQSLHCDAYTFDANSSKLCFNRRSEENRASNASRNQMIEENRSAVDKPEEEVPIHS